MNDFDLHWRCFISLEEDLVSLSRFIELSEDNHNVYSIEIARLLLMTCSEIDAVMKLICAELDENSGGERINEYYKKFERHSLEFKEEVVHLKGQSLRFQPWSDWKENGSPAWWKQYNDVKHNRSQNFTKANLRNFLNALSGLFIVLFQLRQLRERKKYPLADCHVDKLGQEPKLLIFPDRFRYTQFLS